MKSVLDYIIVSEQSSNDNLIGGGVMRPYKLVYLQPFERDDDSGPGIGDHSIQHARQEAAINANSDKEAMLAVSEFVEHGSIVFDHHIDGDGKVYMRKPVELTTTRIVHRWNGG